MCVATATAQSTRNSPSARDVAREIQRVDREQLLLRSPLPAKNSETARLTLLKKIKADFRSLQAVNNKMMEEVWATDQVNYSHTSEMISQVREKAIALKNNLRLPSNDNAKKIESPNTIANLKDLRAALLVLDRFVMNFVNNPVFHNLDVVDVTLASQASHDLEAAITLSGELKKHTLRLNAESRKTH
jgi:hypothetical protein